MEYYYRQLAYAIVLQAVKDFFNTSTAGKRAILKDLRSSYMNSITSGTSRNIAEQLEKHPEEIRKRLHRHSRKEQQNERPD